MNFVIINFGSIISSIGDGHSCYVVVYLFFSFSLVLFPNSMM